MTNMQKWESPPTHLPSLQPHHLHIWRANLNLSDEQIFQFQNTLSNDELARAQRFIFPLHQHRFIAARGFLRKILARYLKQDAATLQFGYTTHGKPYLLNIENLYFNISHSNEWALYAISLEEKIGIDIEKVRNDIALEDIAQRFFSSYENSQLQNTTTAEQKLFNFFQLWTCKEAFIKAVGDGFSLPLKEFDIDLSSIEPKLLRAPPHFNLTKPWSFTTVNFSDDYKTAVAVDEPIIEKYLWAEHD